MMLYEKPTMRTPKHPYIRKAEFEDVITMYPHLRKADIDEIRAEGRDDFSVILSDSMRKSAECYTVIAPHDTKKPRAMFGVGYPTLHHELSLTYYPIWLLGTEDITGRYGLRFLKHCKEWVDYFSYEYGPLGNYVHSKNLESRYWLDRLCKFKLRHRQVHPITGEEFCFYYKRK